jgi:hypothetical protein
MLGDGAGSGIGPKLAILVVDFFEAGWAAHDVAIRRRESDGATRVATAAP